MTKGALERQRIKREKRRLKKQKAKDQLLASLLDMALQDTTKQMHIRHHVNSNRNVLQLNQWASSEAICTWQTPENDMHWAWSKMQVMEVYKLIKNLHVDDLHVLPEWRKRMKG